MLLPITYPDAQQALVDYLRPLLSPVPIGARVPDPRPSTFVNTRRVGGVADGAVEHARLDVFAWAATDEAAHDMVQNIRRFVARMAFDYGGARVIQTNEFAGPQPAPDPSNQPRWLVTFEITLRGVA